MSTLEHGAIILFSTEEYILRNLLGFWYKENNVFRCQHDVFDIPQASLVSTPHLAPVYSLTFETLTPSKCRKSFQFEQPLFDTDRVQVSWTERLYPELFVDGACHVQNCCRLAVINNDTLRFWTHSFNKIKEFCL